MAIERRGIMGRKKDYTGEIFGKLTIKEFDEQQNKWKCECKCGKIVYYTSRQLQINKPKSCGCLRSEDLTGKVFGRLLVKERTDMRDNNYNIYYLCECLCNDTERNTKLVTAHDLKAGIVKSCGCLKGEAISITGKALGEKTKEYCIAGTNVRNLTMKTARNNTSGIRGVTWDASKGKWAAYINFQKKHYYLGRYDTKEEAATVRKIAEEKLFGNFLNWYENEFKKNVVK